jgi:hypothetical protein
MTRRTPFVLALLAAITSRTALAAEPDATKALCLSAYESGQRERRAGQLQAAKSSFGFCGSNACPRAMHGDCGRWLGEVEAEIPTAVFLVSNADTALDAASVAIDGGPAYELDGRAVELDPGEHSIVFSHPGYESLERRFSFSAGEKLVQRRVELAPLGDPAPIDAVPRAPVPPRVLESAPSSSLLPTWLGAGVGALGVAGLVYFGSNARKDESGLEACSPRCSTARVADVRREYFLANVSLGVGAAGLLTAAGWLLFRPEGAEPERQRLSLRIGPVTTLRGRF